MTSTVIIKAHCTDDKIVRVVETDFGTPKHDEIEHRLEDGSELNLVVYDDKCILVQEELK